MPHSTLASAADIDHRFDYHKPIADRIAAHEAVRAACKELAHFIDDRVPNGREKERALNGLEEAMFWANSAIARERD